MVEARRVGGSGRSGAGKGAKNSDRYAEDGEEGSAEGVVGLGVGLRWREGRVGARMEGREGWKERSRMRGRWQSKNHKCVVSLSTPLTVLYAREGDG